MNSRRASALATGLGGQRFAPRVLVVALSGDDGVRQVPEGGGVLQRVDLDVALERLQRDLDRVPSRLPVAAG